MKDDTSLSHDLNIPVKAVCPRCGTENSFVPARTPYLYCRRCHYVYAWVSKEGRLIIEGKRLSSPESSDK
ncbi:MAG TPA: hypothetical protein PLF44_03885 [Candidatus Mcinerneyibacteriales bacterium]|nr:hypothetical protein [Candidatus Mcinerneyibacteriales bacterium]HPQ88864.1 hypothetical protein [Candidatus Mcinerneyibacteriales bacterium]